MRQISESANETYKNWLPSIKEIDNLKLSFARIRASEYTYVLTKDEKDLSGAMDYAANKLLLLEKQKELYEKLISEPEEKEIYGKLKPKMESFLSHYNEVIDLVKKNDKELATQKIRKEFLKEYTDITKDLDKLSDVNFNDAKKRNNIAELTYLNSI